MKNFVIPPTNHLDLSSIGEAGFYILAHLYLENENYRNFVKLQKDKGRFLLLDNSAAERKLVTEDQLIQICHEILPNEVIPPDVLFDKEATERNLFNFVERMQKEDLLWDVKIFFCPQGKTQEEWVSSYKMALNFEFISTIGLSKIAVPRAFLNEIKDDVGIAKGRNKCVKFLSDNDLITKNLHYLGLGEFTEFDYYKTLPYHQRKFFRSTDSCYTVLSAYHGIDFSKGDNRRIPTPHDYFELNFHPEQVELAKSNATFFKNYIKDINPDRGTGKTTRQIDEAIQILFNTGKCTILDHNGSKVSNRYQLDRVLFRLSNEHPSIINKLKIDYQKFIIKLLP